jgi:NAD(P)H-quinone oxidoreductase subunit 5
MTESIGVLIAFPPLALLAARLIPGDVADRQVELLRRVSLGLSALTLAMAIVAAAVVAAWGPQDVALVSWPGMPLLNVGIYLDSLSVVMLLLISFIGLIIVRYSVRYLDGEATQGRFLRSILFTLGAVLVMVLSRNLLMFTAAWMMTSYALHRLLLHYPDRAWAVWAARKKFLISRLGDAMLIAALVLTFRAFGSFDYHVIFDAVSGTGPTASAPVWMSPGWLVSLIGVCFVIGAMTKSAQFPFHSWLPDTMETPTPVSALMHAGVINAGGFLVIRLSPLIAQSHVALDLLAAIGALTAIFGGVVMMTQTSIKRSLAYSTIAQMGFMMLQCGLGAFSAALLHIVAHSLYKAHAFLSCGSVLERAARVRTSPSPEPSAAYRIASCAVAALIAVGASLLAASFWGISLGSKPGGAVLGLVTTLALTQLIWQSLLTGSKGLAVRGIGLAAVIAWVYLGGWLATDYLLGPAVPRQMLPMTPIDRVVIALVACGFIGAFMLQAAAAGLAHLPWVRAFYIHATNGFYADIPARRITAKLWGGVAPTP